MISVIVWGAQAGISGASLVLGRPWTGLLARRRYDAEAVRDPLFRRVNAEMSGLWTVYFALACVAASLGGPWISLALGVPTPVLGWLSFKAGDWRARQLATRREAGSPAVLLP